MRFVVIYLVLALLIYLRGIMPVVHDHKTRLWCMAAVMPGALFPSVARFVGGSMVAPDLPAWVMYVGSLFQNFTLLLAILIVFREVLSVGLRILGVPFPYLGKNRPTAGAILLLSIALASYGMYQSVIGLKVVEKSVPIPNLPAELEGFRIAQLSDLHVSSVFSVDRVREVVERTNALKPDLIAVTGDLVDGTPQRRAADLEPLKDLKARYGVFAVEGNHEHYVDYDGWMKVLPNLGMQWLSNESATVKIGKTTMAIVGLTDPMAQRYGRRLPDIEKAMALLDGNEDFHLLLSHQPKYARLYADKADLMLSGHTHGGQIPAINPIVAKLNQGFVSGLYSLGRLQLYVNQGTDVWNGFLLRLGTIGEITLITLTRAESSASHERVDR